MADIDFDELTEDWVPIGNLVIQDEQLVQAGYSFDGTFNGNGHVIKNLRVGQSSTPPAYAGLFGHADNSTIYNLHLLNPKVKGTVAVGTVAGYATNTRIVDVLVRLPHRMFKCEGRHLGRFQSGGHHPVSGQE